MSFFHDCYYAIFGRPETGTASREDRGLRDDRNPPFVVYDTRVWVACGPGENCLTISTGHPLSEEELAMVKTGNFDFAGEGPFCRCIGVNLQVRLIMPNVRRDDHG